jgi:RHS repeat-associated protein
MAGVGAENGSKLGSVPTTYSSPLLGSDIATLISDDSTTYVSTRPKAFLNWMVVGEDYVAATSSPNHVNAIQILVCNSGDTSKQIVGLTNMVVRRNGWIYIYLSNESAMDVFFDNLVINLKHGPLVEQKDYYAFGMENPALSTKALKYNYDENRIKYNGTEYDTAFGLDYYEAFYRDLDPQIGRWTTIDPKVEDGQEMWSPYVSNYDNPVRYQDPKGDCPTCLLGALIGGLVDAAVLVAGNMANGQSFSTAVSNINGTQVAIAAAAGFVTSGVSAIYSSAAATGTAIAVSEATTQAAVVGTSSVLSQVNDNISKGKDAMNISPVKMVTDIATDHVATNISKSVATTSVTTAERQLNRTERVAANDPASSGRHPMFSRLKIK